MYINKNHVFFFVPTLKIIYGKTVKAEFGNTIAYADIQKPPTIQFDADQEKFYCLYMSGWYNMYTLDSIDIVITVGIFFY